MWNLIPQLGMATAIVDMTNELSPLLIGLVSVMWLSATMIGCTALRHYLARKTQPKADTTSGSTSGREAA
jgi:hypothetical protein